MCYCLLEDFKVGKIMFFDCIIGFLEDMQMGNIERVFLIGIYIYGNMDILVVQIDSNIGIDIMFEGMVMDFDFVEQFFDYMV